MFILIISLHILYFTIDTFSPLGGHILAPEYSHLNDYIFPFTIEEESQLVAVGYQEHVGLGGRFASRVQQLLGGATETELRLIASTRNRSIDSAKGFRQVMAKCIFWSYMADPGFPRCIECEILRS